MLGGRYAYRLRAERRLRPRVASPALLFGAGAAGHHLVRAILHDRRSPYIPVGVLDDDPDKCHLRVHGVPVFGDVAADLAAVARKTGAATVIFAVANAEAALIRDVRRSTLEAGLAFKVVPSVAELLGGRISVANVRDAAIGDLLGPAPGGDRPRHRRRPAGRAAGAGHRRRAVRSAPSCAGRSPRSPRRNS
jgi:FlaA1/EpsC-like NDP-sugar epimerase